jgi:uncharacterized membrane protein HdeD (DUF308 family)
MVCEGETTMPEQPAIEQGRLSISQPGSWQEIWALLMGMGVALMILGMMAIGSSLIATLATVLVFGILLLLGAIFEIVTALWGRSWRGFFLHLLAGVLYLVAGIFMINNPVEAALGLTLLVAACLLTGGILRIIQSALDRFDGWGWVLVNGMVSLLLGTAIWRQWPLSGTWVIGLFVGIEMLFSGLSWVMLGLAARSTRKTAIL